MKIRAINTPAFPVPVTSHDGEPYWGSSGMDLRDYFAAKAIAIYWDSPDAQEYSCTIDSLAKWCYEVADAMMKARSK